MFEPISTLALVAAFLAPIPLTRRPEWSARPQNPVDTVAPVDKTWSPAFSELTTETEEVVSANYRILDRSEILAMEVNSYAALPEGWDGPGSVRANAHSLAAALEFIALLPGGLPLPRPMLSSAGEVGFYWDLERGFADISFETNGSASFFSRAHTGEESFQDDLKANLLTRDWFFGSIGSLAFPQANAA